MKKRKLNKYFLLILSANLILITYTIIIGIVGWKLDWESNIIGSRTPVVAILIIMFTFELLSTVTFQFRIWLTSKDKIIAAAFVGSISWCIAGLQGLLLINGDITHLNEVQTFFVKMPPVLIATFVGILTNHTIKLMMEKKRVENKKEESNVNQ